MQRHDEIHAARVDAWLAAQGEELSTRERRRLFEHALTALLRRASRTLGEGALRAILDRVLFTAIERYPLLAALELARDGIRWGGEPPRAELAGEVEREACRFLLVELLTVLGILSGGILVPPLHAELASVRRPRPGART